MTTKSDKELKFKRKLNAEQLGIHTYSRVSICRRWNDGCFSTDNIDVRHKITDATTAQFRIFNETDAALHQGHDRVRSNVPQFLQVRVSAYIHCKPGQQTAADLHL